MTSRKQNIFRLKINYHFLASLNFLLAVVDVRAKCCCRCLFSISLLISIFVAKNNHRTKYVHELVRTDFSRFDYLRLKTLTYARLLFFTGGNGAGN